MKRVNCCDISDDSSWLVLGLSDSTVRVCSLADKMKLKMIKQLQDLELLDKESGLNRFVNDFSNKNKQK